MSNDTLWHGTAANNTVRCMAAVTTNLVGEAMLRHRAAPTTTAALGRTLTGTLLLGSTLKELDRLTVQVRGNGPVGHITAEANGQGQVRGYVGRPHADLPRTANGKFDVGGIVGQGMLHVMREAGFAIGFRPEPYRGSVPLVSGEIAEDFAYYLTASEQIPSAVLLGVLLEPDSEKNLNPVTAAGGVMLQMMPGAAPETIAHIEENILQMPQLTTLIRQGAGPQDLLQAALGTLAWQPLADYEVAFACNCSYARAVALVSALPPEDIAEMLEQDGQAVLTCHFCNTDHRLDRAALEQILASAG